jgi:hypothetical protein
MQTTGIVPRRPTTAWEVWRLSLIWGRSGPTATICGRSVSAPRKSAASSVGLVLRGPLLRSALTRSSTPL